MSHRATPDEIQAAMEAIGGAAPALESLVEGAAALRGLTADNPPTGGYVGIRPALNGTISVYINRVFADVALEPERARSVALQRGWTLLRTNSVTGRVRIPAGDLTSPEVLEFATNLVLEALDKSLNGPPYEGGNAGSRPEDVAYEVCPTHNEAMLGGVCERCD